MTDPSPQPDTPAPAPGLVQNGDLARVIWIMAGSLLLLVAFGLWLHVSDLLDVIDVSDQKLRGTADRYFQDALDYRERRLTLGMVLRTFTTGLAFAIGLALCTQGGIFILRQVRAFTEVAIHHAAPANPGDKTPVFSFSSYSPGVVFLLGGVVLMVSTQYFSLPVTSADIVHPQAVGLCPADHAPGTWMVCTPQTPSGAGALTWVATGQGFCDRHSLFPGCLKEN